MRPVACCVQLGYTQSQGNAFDTYQRAAELLKTPEFSTYQQWMPASGTKNETPPQSPSPLAQHLAKLSYLKVKEGEVVRFAPALDLLARAQLETYTTPKLAATDFQLLANCKALAKLAADAEYVYLAEGQGERSAQVLDQALTMGQRIEGSSLLSVLVGIAVQAIAIAPYNRRMAAIPVGVARTLANRTGELLSDKAFVRAFLKGERDSLLDLIGTTINSMSQPDQQDGASKQFRSLDSSSRIEWVNHATAIIDGSLDQTRQLLEGPESEWMKMSTPEQIEPFGDKDFDAPKSLKEVEATLRTASSFAGNRQMIQALLRGRTLMRLLRLHCLVIQYQWEHGTFPPTLAAAGIPAADQSDPFSGKQFQFVLQGGSYRLFSLGIPQTGEIELKYQAPPGGTKMTDPDRP